MDKTRSAILMPGYGNGKGMGAIGGGRRQWDILTAKRWCAGHTCCSSDRVPDQQSFYCSLDLTGNQRSFLTVERGDFYLWVCGCV